MATALIAAAPINVATTLSTTAGAGLATGGQLGGPTADVGDRGLDCAATAAALAASLAALAAARLAAMRSLAAAMAVAALGLELLAGRVDALGRLGLDRGELVLVRRRPRRWAAARTASAVSWSSRILPYRASMPFLTLREQHEAHEHERRR